MIKDFCEVRRPRDENPQDLSGIPDLFQHGKLVIVVESERYILIKHRLQNAIAFLEALLCH